MPGAHRHSPALRSEAKLYKDPSGTARAAKDWHYTHAIGEALEAELKARKVADHIELLRDVATSALRCTQLLAEHGVVGFHLTQYAQAFSDVCAGVDLLREENPILKLAAETLQK